MLLEKKGGRRRQGEEWWGLPRGRPQRLWFGPPKRQSRAAKPCSSMKAFAPGSAILENSPRFSPPQVFAPNIPIRRPVPRLRFSCPGSQCPTKAAQVVEFSPTCYNRCIVAPGRSTCPEPRVQSFMFEQFASPVAVPETVPEAPPQQPDTRPGPAPATPDRKPGLDPFNPDWPAGRPEPQPKA
jgi:hypothetical protein